MSTVMEQHHWLTDALAIRYNRVGFRCQAAKEALVSRPAALRYDTGIAARLGVRGPSGYFRVHL
jgi:hypothetical protein